MITTKYKQESRAATR